MQETLQKLAHSLSVSAGMLGIIVNNHTQNAQQMRLQVEVLGKYFDFIDHDELQGVTQKKLKKPFCFFTFDDGKKILELETAREMERLGVPGAFYIVTDSATHGHIQWADKFAALQKHEAFNPQDWGLQHPKTLPYSMLEERLQKACEHCAVTPDTDDPRVAVMDWDDIRSLSDRGFTIGSHTCRHAILTNEPEEEAKADIDRSIQCVSDELGRQCETFAFPNGNHNMTLCTYAEQCGVGSVMSTDPRWQRRRDPMYALPRIQLHNNFDRKRITQKIIAAVPGVLLTNPDGTGRSYVLNQIKKSLGLGF